MKSFMSLARPARSVRRRPARCLIAEQLEDRTLLSTFSVSNTDDHGPGSLRQAIVDANNNANVGGFPDEIDFEIPGSGLQVISPTSSLPAIIDPVVIDGYSQTGSSPNAVVDGDSATLLIVLDGSLEPLADGLLLYAGNSTVRGLVINGFNEGIRVSSVGGNVIEGNFIGTDATGLFALGNANEGIDVDDSPGNTIGGSTLAARNVISGTLASPGFGYGVVIYGIASIGNLVQGNFIGTDATGTRNLGNADAGVSVTSLVGSPDDPASQTTIRGNLISGNLAGIAIVGGGNNLVAGNLIGTDVSGTKKLGNVRDGVYITDTATNGSGVAGATTGNNTIGGTTPAARNVISGNGLNGVAIIGAKEVGNLVLGNYIGTNTFGQMDVGVDLGNTLDGVRITRIDAGGAIASANRIGGITAEERNVISGNHQDGVSIIGDSGPEGNLVQGNYIGTDSSGTGGMKNDRSGVRLYSGDFKDSASNNTIGGTVIGAGNLISANGESGISILGADTGGTGNVVQGNFIGTDITGTSSLANNFGVSISAGASGNLIGAGMAGATAVITPGAGSVLGQATANAGNLISGNTGVGVDIRDNATSKNLILGNLIGTGLDGDVRLGNANGVQVSAGASFNTIGGVSAGEGNLISGNLLDGIFLYGDSGHEAIDNMVQGNYIGTNLAGSVSVANAAGVDVGHDTLTTEIGGEEPGARNLISGNTHDGIRIFDSLGTLVTGNFIGTDRAGTTRVGNGDNGVFISSGAKGSYIGIGVPGAGNLISGNIAAGILIEDDGTGTTDNYVQANLIGTDVTGEDPLGNSMGVAIARGASNNYIGGSLPEARNIISGNVDNGIVIQDSGTTGNHVEGNFIGTNKAGTLSLPNHFGVVMFFGASANVIDASNVISGNTFNGVTIDGARTTANRVEGNTIGANQDASGPLGNRYGVVISGGAFGNFIGGTDAETRNLISGNDVDDGIGVLIRDAGTTGNVVEGNYIGTEPAGNDFISNNVGVVITLGAFGNVIGGLALEARNVISGNLDVGVEISGTGTMGNLIEGNYIGTDGAGGIGLPGLPNLSGVRIDSGASENVIGGTEAGAGNLISGNINNAITISDTGTTANRVEGNLIGTNVDGSGALANRFGVVISGSASGNVIGGTAPEARNTISGNRVDGVRITDTGTTNNQVDGNYIGTARDGSGSVANTFGVQILSGATGNVIGGTSSGAGNLISGNSDTGITIIGAGTSANRIEGNLIGTNQDGSGPLSNLTGVLISAGATENVIGGTDAGAANVISGNTSVDGIDGAGVEIVGIGTTGNLVEGNFIGTNPDGSAAVANRVGVSIGSGASANVIGGAASEARNLISGNNAIGIIITDSGTTLNLVEGNLIGTDNDGSGRLGNASGVTVSSGASGNVIGGTDAGAGNVISGNPLFGVVLEGAGTTGNRLEGNLIGTDKDGGGVLYNNTGVLISSGASANVIGGTAPSARNVISGNKLFGVLITDTGTTGNLVQGNSIGTAKDGASPLGNATTGVRIDADDNAVGEQPAARPIPLLITAAPA